MAGGWFAERARRVVRGLAPAGVLDQAHDDRFRSLVQHSSDVITVTDAVGRILYSSPSVSRVFGYDPADHGASTGELER